MRRSLTAAAVLLLFAAGLLPWLHGQVNGAKEEIQIKEEILYGDADRVQGLLVCQKTYLLDHLFWNTQLFLGTGRQAQTVFSYFGETPRIEGRRLSSDIGIAPVGRDFSVSGLIDLAEEEKNSGYGQLIKPIADVASRTEPGRTHAETVYLKEYYDVYPLEMQLFRTWQYFDSMESLSRLITEYFSLVVPEDLKMTVTVTKDEKGDIVEIIGQDSSNPAASGTEINFGYIGAVDTADEAGGYFLFYRRGEDGRTRARPESGYSIYFIPAEQKEDYREPLLKAEDIAPVYDLAEGEAPVHLQFNRSRSQLLLFTEAEDSLWLNVIDRQVMECRQRILIGAWEKDDWMDVFSYPGFMSVVMENKETPRLVLLCDEEERGTWRMEMTAELAWQGQEGLQTCFVQSGAQMAYDGRRLAVAQWSRNYATDMDLMICQEGGVVFYGRYRRQGEYQSQHYNYRQEIRPQDDDENGLQLKWAES